VDRLLICFTPGASVDVPMYCLDAINDDPDLTERRLDKIIFASMSENVAIGPGQHEAHYQIARKYGLQKNHYMMVADLDEFFQFSVSPKQLVKEHPSAPCFFGHLVERVAFDGSLIQVRPYPSRREDCNFRDGMYWWPELKEQFPKEVRFTELVLRGGTRKVMLNRAEVRVGAGHHDAYFEDHLIPESNPTGSRLDWVVHHYKLKLGLIERLEYQLASGAATPRWCREAEAALKYFKDHNGKVDFNDPQGLTDVSKRNLDISTF
jgi:hypothetical protein